jgi:serine/threonine protein phosphatase PrpC
MPAAAAGRWRYHSGVDRIVLASKLKTKGDSLCEAVGGGIAVAAHTGVGTSLNPKYWVCEDSLAAHRLSEGDILATVADAHWGGSSSEAVAREFKSAWGEADGSGVPKLERTLLAIEARYRASRARGDESDTTVLLVHVRGRTVNFVSVGDSLLVVIGPNACRLQNVPRGAFMGQQPLTQFPGTVQSGRFQLAPDESVLLASDGLEPEASGLGLDEVASYLRGADPLEERLRQLLLRASDPAHAGGRDNLALVAIEP